MQFSAKLKAISITGGITFAIALSLSIIQPPKPADKNPEGFRTPIVALELAESPAEISGIVGVAGSENEKLFRARFLRGIYLDYAFMIFYGSFLFICIITSNMHKTNILYFAIFTSVLCVLSDAFENIQLIKVLRNHDDLEALNSLRFFTLVKWLILSVISYAIAYGLSRTFRDKIGFILFLVPSLAGFAILFERAAVEVQGLGLAVAWLYFFIRSLPTRFQFKTRET